MKNDEAVHDAVKRADLKSIRALLAAGVSANVLDSSGMPPLAYVLDHDACIGFVLTEDTTEMIRLLRAAGANPGLNGAGKHLVSMASKAVSSSIESHDRDRLEQLLV